MRSPVYHPREFLVHSPKRSPVYHPPWVLVHSPMRSPVCHPREFWYIHQSVHPCVTPVSFGTFTNAFTRVSPPWVLNVHSPMRSPMYHPVSFGTFTDAFTRVSSPWVLVHSPMRSSVYHLREFWYIHQSVHPCVIPVSFWYIHQCVHPCITPVSFGTFTNAFTRVSPQWVLVHSPMRSPVYHPREFPQVSEPIQTNHLLTTCLTQSERASLHTCCWYQCRSIWKIIETASEPKNVTADLDRKILDSPTSTGSSGLVGEGNWETWNLCCCLQRPSFHDLFLQDQGGTMAPSDPSCL